MTRVGRNRQTVEFGDFQTPHDLARKACELLASQAFQPQTIIEPTCGAGNFLVAALEQFPSATEALGLDISPAYIEAARTAIERSNESRRIELIEGDFFTADWPLLLAHRAEPLLVVGNPPWVTNARLGVLNSANLPAKTNFQNHSGFDAMTGKSNFDISEWILIRVLQWLDKKEAAVGMLCKTSVARKLLAYAWRNRLSLSGAAIHRFDAARHFGASVDSCFFICRFSPSAHNPTCRVYGGLNDKDFVETLGSSDGAVVSIELFERWQHLRGDNNRWRSGIKHDCSKVMELTKEGDKYRNGLGELVELEETFVYPMLKSSDLARDSVLAPRRWMLVTQKGVRDDTAALKEVAPKTWDYLLSHAEFLDKRGSSIYKNRPRFSVFGIGEYSFSFWKVAISGFYKKLSFKVVGAHDGKPMVLDDTAYFIPCESQREAERLSSFLNSQIAQEFFQTYIFWDSKRPITVDILRRLDLSALEKEFNKGAFNVNDSQPLKASELTT
jgi:hypothetical protein